MRMETLGICNTTDDCPSLKCPCVLSQPHLSELSFQLSRNGIHTIVELSHLEGMACPRSEGGGDGPS